ncbi:MAG TPA: rhodanese-like domain-containing protein [Jatrophihabitantaceae bacterium]|jgi:rhodanese-related sulfurtransferase
MRPFDIPTVSVDQIPTGAVLLDVREPDEWAAGHVEDAVHVPMNEIPARAGELEADTDLVVVCKVGGRSAQVTAWLNQQGYRATNLEGGMIAWAAARRPMVSDTGAPPAVI